MMMTIMMVNWSSDDQHREYLTRPLLTQTTFLSMGPSQLIMGWWDDDYNDKQWPWSLTISFSGIYPVVVSKIAQSFFSFSEPFWATEKATTYSIGTISIPGLCIALKLAEIQICQFKISEQLLLENWNLFLNCPGPVHVISIDQWYRGPLFSSAITNTCVRA